MIFNCGKTWKQKWKEKEERLTNWHDKFLWFPTTIEIKSGIKTCCWLETVKRKGTLHHGWDSSYWLWQYKRKEK